MNAMRKLDERFHAVTARMVLNHSPGFPNWRSGNSINFIKFTRHFTNSYNGLTIAEELIRTAIGG